MGRRNVGQAKDETWDRRIRRRNVGQAKDETWDRRIMFSQVSDETWDRRIMFSQVRGKHEITPPEIAFDFLEFYRPMLGKVVFVKKKIYGGDMEYNCILRGKVKNLSNLPFKNVCILWYFWDSADNLIEISPTSYYNPPPQYWLDQLNYLDSRSEVDFEINLDIQQMSPVDGNAIKQAVISGRNEAYIAIPNL